MPALLSWILMLGGIATTVAAAALSAEVEFEVALALGGLLATLLGAVGLLLSRVAGDVPADLRPPGATSRVNPPVAGAPAASTGRRRPARTRSRDGQQASVSVRPPSTAVPTGPTRAGISRTPVLVAAFILGVAWDLTQTEGASGPLDMLAGLIFLATPLAAVVAIATRLLRGRAWGPAVTLLTVGIGVIAGSFVAEIALGLLS